LLFYYQIEGSLYLLSLVKKITRTGDNPLTYYYLLTGQKSQIVYPNNASVNLSYDDQGQLTSLINRRPDASVLSSYDRIIDHLKLRFMAGKPPPSCVFQQVALKRVRFLRSGRGRRGRSGRRSALEISPEMTSRP
jgi:hypothetical protein